MASRWMLKTARGAAAPKSGAAFESPSAGARAEFGVSGDLPALSVCRLEAPEELLRRLRQHNDDPALADFTCPICYDPFWQPVRTVCGHAFCEGCLLKSVLAQLGHEQPDVSCPMCRHPLHVDDVAIDQALLTRIRLVLTERSREDGAGSRRSAAASGTRGRVHRGLAVAAPPGSRPSTSSSAPAPGAGGTPRTVAVTPRAVTAPVAPIQRRPHTSGQCGKEPLQSLSSLVVTAAAPPFRRGGSSLPRPPNTAPSLLVHGADEGFDGDENCFPGMPLLSSSVAWPPVVPADVPAPRRKAQASTPSGHSYGRPRLAGTSHGVSASARTPKAAATSAGLMPASRNQKAAEDAQSKGPIRRSSGNGHRPHSGSGSAGLQGRARHRSSAAPPPLMLARDISDEGGELPAATAPVAGGWISASSAEGSAEQRSSTATPVNRGCRDGRPQSITPGSPAGSSVPAGSGLSAVWALPREPLDRGGCTSGTAAASLLPMAPWTPDLSFAADFAFADRYRQLLEDGA